MTTYTKVYIFDDQGMHSGAHTITGVKSELKAALMAFDHMDAPEIRVCDEGDSIILHMKRGAVMWPDEYRKVQIAGNLGALIDWLHAKIDDTVPKLNWYQRPDQLWNADCACGATLCGVHGEQAMMVVMEMAHQRNVEFEKETGQQRDPCGKVPLVMP